MKYKILLMIIIFSVTLFGEDKSEKGNIILPILISNPEVGFAGGAYIMHYDMKGRDKTPDTLQAGIAYTTKNQKQIFCSTQNLFGDIKLNTDSEVKSWASRYYHRSSDSWEYEKYTDNNANLKIMGQKVFKNGWSTGVVTRLMYSHLTDKEKGGILEIQKPFGSENLFFSGVGETAKSIDKLNIDNIKMSYGAGARFNLGKEDKMNIRIDFALNNLNGKKEETSGLYVDLLEAF